MKIALCGLAACGKSTVFKALVGRQTQPKKTALRQVQLNMGTIQAKDERLKQLAQLLHSEKITYPQINLIDIVHLGEKADQGLDTANIKDADILGIVIGIFCSQNPAQDLASIEAELILSDLQTIQNRIEKIKKEKKGKVEEEDPELLLIKRCAVMLEKEEPLRGLALNPEEVKMLAGFQLLTFKPTIVIANLSEDQLNKKADEGLVKQAEQKGWGYFSFCAKLEAEIEELSEAEREGFLEVMGLKNLSRDKFLQSCLQAQDLIFFFTVVGKEARAWLIPKGTSALQAAGSVHSDMQRGFIRAEVINYQEFVACGSFPKAKEKGLLRLESKEYQVQDGDIINFKFSV